MAFLRKRESGNYSLSVKWKGKSCIKALGSDNEQEANQIKKDAEDQLQSGVRLPPAQRSAMVIFDRPFLSDSLPEEPARSKALFSRNKLLVEVTSCDEKDRMNYPLCAAKLLSPRT